MAETPLLDLVGLDEPARRRRLAFLGIAQSDRDALAELQPFVEGLVDDLVERFYAYILGFAETAAFLADASLVERLKSAQREHFVSLTGGVHDAAYFESRLRVGMTHARIQLEPQWYLGAYSVQLVFLTQRLLAAFGDSPERLERYVSALIKVIMLDIELATHAYIYGGFVERSLAEAHAREAERATDALRAKEVEEARREELLGMVVHDVRSPVTAMMSTARAGLRRYQDTAAPPGKQFSLIEHSGRSVLAIIDNMLAVARMAQGQMPVELEAFDAAELVRSCVEELRPVAQQGGHGVITDTVESLPVDALDRLLVRRIVSNLLVNAFRHTPTGTQVVVECQGRDGLCVIRVADDGPGLSPRVAERMFGADAQRREGMYVASGLGLPFCRMACERMGGSIRLETGTSRGTCFVVELPAG